ncbi:hypothetical protein [Thermocatellispora tengchongensis]|uniref:hypothetical protein n=1 Tax=Thermocatellispora tengchongensis TaxID=1073253 RepID=UPI00363FBDDD
MDVGNATTEVVVVKDGVPVAWDRVLTRGPKGGPASLRGAAALVDRLERETGERVEEVVLAPLRPVSTATLALPAAAPDTGRLRVVAAASPTPAGEGVAVGRPLLPGDQTPGDAAPGDKTPGDKTPGDTAPGDAAVVALVPRAMGYERAAAWVRTLLAAGVRVAGVLAEGDEARLIGNRIGAPLPVVDQVDLSALADAELVAVEVRPPGRPLAKLSDALFLKAAFPGSAPGEEAHAQAVCRELYDVSNAVVARLRTAAPPPEPAPEPPEATLERAVLDLDALAASVHARPRAVRRRSLLLATLEHEDEAPAADAEEVFRRPVRRAPPRPARPAGAR